MQDRAEVAPAAMLVESYLLQFMVSGIDLAIARGIAPIKKMSHRIRSTQRNESVQVVAVNENPLAATSRPGALS